MTDRTAEVVIIGAGVAGLSTALHLCRAGSRDVVVLEKGYPAEASSGLSAGVFTRQYFDPVSIKLRVNAYEELCRLERDEGLVLVRNGFLRPARSEGQMAEFESAVELQREAGIADAEVFDRSRFKDLIPDASAEGVMGGMLIASDGYLDGQQLSMTYLQAAEAMGAKLLPRTALIGYEEAAGGSHRVITDRGVIECGAVVNAAGGWAGEVGAILGAPLEIRRERHQACIFELPGELGYLLPTVMDYIPGSGVEGLYFRPEGKHQLIAGLHTNEQIDESLVPSMESYFKGVDSDFVDRLIPMLADFMPGLDQMGYREGWSGIYPNSPDDLFMIGECRPGIYAICGLNGVGVYMSPYLGRLAMEWITEGAPSDPDCLRFDPRRFDSKTS